MASQKISKKDFLNLVQEISEKCINEINERSLTPAEEKKKEEIVKALKPKYGKSSKTYAIATAQAKKIAEQENVSEFEDDIFPPHFGINGSNQWLAIIYKNGIVEDNQYFDDEESAKKWINDFKNPETISEDRNQGSKTIKILNWKELKDEIGLDQAKVVIKRLKDDYLKNGTENTKFINCGYVPGFYCLFNLTNDGSDSIIYEFTGTAG